MTALFTGFLAYRGSFFYMILDRDSKFNKGLIDTAGIEYLNRLRSFLEMIGPR